jgi:hypothetical protein
MKTREKIKYTVVFEWVETTYINEIKNYDVPPIIELEIPLTKEQYEVVKNNEDEFDQFCLNQFNNLGEEELLKIGYFPENPQDMILNQLWEFMEKYQN